MTHFPMLLLKKGFAPVFFHLYFFILKQIVFLMLHENRLFSAILIGCPGYSLYGEGKRAENCILKNGMDYPPDFLLTAAAFLLTTKLIPWNRRESVYYFFKFLSMISFFSFSNSGNCSIRLLTSSIESLLFFPSGANMGSSVTERKNISV